MVEKTVSPKNEANFRVTPSEALATLDPFLPPYGLF